MGSTDGKFRLFSRRLRVLEVFLEAPQRALSGAEIQQRCGIASGSLYPILIGLEAAGWCASRWESMDPALGAMPRRRLYGLTSAGLREASGVFASFNKGVLA